MLSTTHVHIRPRSHAPTEVRAALASGDLPRALAATISAYGAEVYGFLRAVMPRGQDARLTYGRSIEVLQRHLAVFGWDTELRVLFYAVARQQARRERVVADGHRLPPEDLELLVLRLDRGFSWRQIAYTSLGGSPAEEELLAEAARLWTRFLAVRRELAPPQAVAS